MYYFPYYWKDQNFRTYYSLLYAHLVCKIAFKNKLLLLHIRANNMIGIFYKIAIKLQIETKNC